VDQEALAVPGGRAQVAVDDPLLVGGLERLGGLLRDREGLVERDRPLGDAVGQRRAFNQLEDEDLLAVGLLEPVDVANVGMVEGSQDLRLALEAREAVGGRP